jgi:malate dehydrogenase (oxaloacetate-decarboxylating)
MASNPIVFAMANPTPEIMPEQAEPHVAVIATGRSDYPNQINNVLCFPGIFRGALDARATCINEEMKLAAANAIASAIGPEELHAEYIVPSVFDKRIAEAVARAVDEAAHVTGVARARRHYPDPKS